MVQPSHQSNPATIVLIGQHAALVQPIPENILAMVQSRQDWTSKPLGELRREPRDDLLVLFFRLLIENHYAAILRRCDEG